MRSSLQESRVLQRSADKSNSGDDCIQQTLSYPREVLPVVERVVAAMAAEGYSKKERFGTSLALEEALVNAIKHGNQSDPTKSVRVRWRVTAERVVVEVEDEGAGFDPQRVPDPLAPENLDRPSGRGLLLMRSYTTWIRFNRRGNCVTLCKCRSVE